MQTRILLTGAATLVGAEILRELLPRPDVRTIGLLLPLQENARREVLERIARYCGPLPATVIPVAADLRLPRFGLSLPAWNELALSFDVAFHCAEREVKDDNLELARQANLRPVETWIQLLARNPELRLHHLSTAFVGGSRRGLFTEFDLDCSQGFHNAWERSKFEAEARLRESRVSDRVTIYRPSHVLGHSTSGEAFQLGGAYSLVGTLAAATVLPGDNRARIDLVPVDYVAASIVALADADARGTFHLSCGWDTSITVAQASTLVTKARDRSRGASLLPRGILWPMRPAGVASMNGLSSRGHAYKTASDYLHQGPVFDTYLADRSLAALGIARPEPPSWIEAAVRGAEARHWESPVSIEFEAPAPESELPVQAAEVALIRKDPQFNETRFHQVGDVKLAYRDIGQGEPVVLCHGIAGAHSWDGVVERVAVRRRALVIETLGLGDSEAPASADYSLWAQAARVRGLLSALNVSVAHIVGNDSGSVIAQIFAVRWPHCVKSLVLSDSDAGDTWPPAHIARLASVMRVPGGTAALSALMRVPAIARSRAGFGQMVYDKRLLSEERLARYVDTLAGNRERRMRLKRFFHAFDPADLGNLNQLLGELQMPAMVIWGAENAYASPSWGKVLFDAIPGARRLELIPFAGVSCHEEKPEAFARLLEELFDEVDAGERAGR
jgi:pimeloyl-ACP methyl ester carboxylesterase/nucleoside-diphosphate-sugar epimerase